MTTKLNSTRRFDAIDREQFKSMLISEGFQAIQQRVEAELQRAIDTCVRSSDQNIVLRAQGAAYALRTVIEMPARLLEEMLSKPA
jgi:hypothetical protein